MGKSENTAIGRRLRQARKNAGLDVPEVAVSTQQSEDTVRAHEKGARGIRPEVAARYARLYKVETEWLLGLRRQAEALTLNPGTGGLPVVGSALAGAFREALEQPEADQERLPVQNDAAYGQAPQFALRVQGPSMNLAYPDGSYVICVSAEDSEARLGDHVICRRERGGLYEFTVKELKLDPKTGQPALFPRSTDPLYQAPVELMPGVEIVAVVIGSYYRRPRRGPAAFGA